MQPRGSAHRLAEPRARAQSPSPEPQPHAPSEAAGTMRRQGGGKRAAMHEVRFSPGVHPSPPSHADPLFLRGSPHTLPPLQSPLCSRHASPFYKRPHVILPSGTAAHLPKRLQVP